ncbi:light-harvesting complex-like protein OHP2, chloroplastic isoform X2 [Prosopis cineraria]|uniref:light-harvesting complex-like protein OHP2, chloroplastic isoform X2 n=1 Tax=Prosopis cineraria TaxID=364024 RepID=UPI0024108C32|nr:light-harvesting complex-like protein OHP2, chloroplastic isoform X2 [Prosopis cineraria]XP_054808891.1 light-harvesting complex-like protein OHP2, chloroplastic isoform X2 [Prosopis cineraria]
MSVAASIPCIKISPCSSSSPSSCTSSSTSSFSLRFSSSKPCCVTIRSSQTQDPLRRPAAQPLKPIPPTPPSPPSPSPLSTTVTPPPKAAAIVGNDRNVITLEFQRQKAKELQEYFKQKKLEETDRGPVFGFIGKNEISNGRGLPMESLTGGQVKCHEVELPRTSTLK